MKFATVLILALVIIQYLEIGDALTPRQIDIVEKKVETVKIYVGELERMIHDTMGFLSRKMYKENATVWVVRRNAMIKLTSHANYIGKAENEATKKCMNLAEQLLITATNDFFQKFKEAFKFRNEHEPRVQECRNLINDFQSVLLKFEEILNGHCSPYVETNYDQSYRRFKYLEKKDQLPRKIFNSEVNEQIKYEYSVLKTRVQEVILTGTECIDQA